MADLYDRPARRLRFFQESSSGGTHDGSALTPNTAAAPAQPVMQPWPQHPQQQHRWMSAEPTAAIPAEADQAGEEGPPASLPPCRWLACCYKSGQLGIAAFDRYSNELSALQVPDDNKGAWAFQMLQYVKLQINPQVIVLPATAEAALLTAAKAPAAAAAGAAVDGEGSDEEMVLQLQRPSIFTYDKAMKMLSAVSVRQQLQQATASRQANAPAAAGLINLAAQQQVAALGALVAVLLQTQQEEEGASGALVVDKLSEMSLDGHLLIDGPSLAALDVFKEEEHPSAMGIGTSKEGVSVYSLLQRCVTGMGKRLLRQWFLRPVVHLETLSDRHDTIELLIAAPETIDALRAAMIKIHDLPRLLAQLRLSQARPRLQAFKQLAGSIQQLIQLQQTIAALAPAAAAEAAAGPGTEAAEKQQQQRQSRGRASNDGLPGWLQLDVDQEDNTAFGMWGHAAATGGSGGGDQVQPVPGPWDKLSISKKLLSVIGSELAACGTLIGDVLDLQSPPIEGCLVQPGVCDALDQLKATHAALPELLTQVVEAELQRVPAHVARRYSRQLWSMVYIPQVGFVMCLTGGRLPEELAELLPDYSLAFIREDGPAGLAAEGGVEGVQLDSCCAYYHCDCTQQLNSQYGDMQYKIQDLESSICTELIKRLLEFGPCLSGAAAVVAELDCLASFAAAARELGYVRPILTQDNLLLIEKGRHPLTELLAEGRFIPNDTSLGLPMAPPPGSGDQAGQEEQQQQQQAAANTGQGAFGPRMLLITGPNASGKSVYMKQVALIVYLAHVGSFVPADRAVVGLTDRILTRLPGCSLEAVSHHTSSFMADLGQVSLILHRATSRSLVLLDEFGKGTLTSDGVGLLAAILQHYAAQPVPPMLLACTHFVELLAPDILPTQPQLQYCTMHVLVSSAGAGSSAAEKGHGAAAGGSDGKHVFLYKLVQGKVAASYGLNCARMCGVDSAVLLRAADVMALQQAGRVVSRLQLPQLEQRDEQYWQLLRQLAALDVADGLAVKQLLARMLVVEAAADDTEV